MEDNEVIPGKPPSPVSALHGAVGVDWRWAGLWGGFRATDGTARRLWLPAADTDDRDALSDAPAKAQDGR